MGDMDKKEHVDPGGFTTTAAESTKDFDVSGISDPEKVSDDSTKPAEPAEATDAEFQYVTGVKLWLATAAVTLVCFLMMLDISIIVTVRYDYLLNALSSLIYVEGYSSYHHRFSFAGRCWLVRQRISFGKVCSHNCFLFIVTLINFITSCALQPSIGKIYSNFGSKVSSSFDFGFMC
jgi:hypothetical protein